MRFLATFLLWATLLAVPCVAFMSAYQRLLGAAAAGILGGLGMSVVFDHVQLMAPCDLGLFVALCLASPSEPRRPRARTVLVGVGLLVAIEVATMLAFVALSLAASGNGGIPPLSRFANGLLETVPWVSSAVMWLVLTRGGAAVLEGLAGLDRAIKPLPANRPGEPTRPAGG